MATELETIKAENGGLQKEVEKLRGMVAGADRTSGKHADAVKQLQAENALLLLKLEKKPDDDLDDNTDDDDKPNAGAAIAQLLLINDFAKDRDIDPKMLFSIMGSAGETDAERLQKLGELTAGIEQAARNKVLGENGRNPHESIQLNLEPLTLEAIANLTPSQQEALSAETTQAALEEYSKRQKGTVRKRISASLFGGKS